MSKESWGASATIGTQGRGLLGLRGRIILPSAFEAHGIDADHYFDAYFGIFTTSPATAFTECGVGFYGEQHRGKALPGQKLGQASFPGCWSTLLNPVGGRLLGQPRQGQRNERYDGPTTLQVELVVSSPNKARFLVNGQPFRGIGEFEFGYGGRGVEPRTFADGFNLKACIGLNDIGGKGVRFGDMTITIDRVLRRKPGGTEWIAPPPMKLLHGLATAVVSPRGSNLTVRYPR